MLHQHLLAQHFGGTRVHRGLGKQRLALLVQLAAGFVLRLHIGPAGQRDLLDLRALFAGGVHGVQHPLHLVAGAKTHAGAIRAHATACGATVATVALSHGSLRQAGGQRQRHSGQQQAQRALGETGRGGRHRCLPGWVVDEKYGLRRGCRGCGRWVKMCVSAGDQRGGLCGLSVRKDSAERQPGKTARTVSAECQHQFQPAPGGAAAKSCPGRCASPGAARCRCGGRRR